MEIERLLDAPGSQRLDGGESGPTVPTKPQSGNWLQVFIVLGVCLCEPITAFVPMPFLAQASLSLVNETGITQGDSSRVGYHIGIIESSFFLTQALCILHWGRLSDRIGRRPVLLTGLFGLIASMLSFGLAKSVTTVVLSRMIAGVLNGNVGVAKTMLAELTNDSNRARVLSLFPITWVIGLTIAPVIGGALQHPAERLLIFKGNKFLAANPYFLPCFVSALCCACAWVFAFFALGETLNAESKVRSTNKTVKSYGAIPNASTPSSVLDPNVLPTTSEANDTSLRSVLTRPVILAITNYGWLALIEISFWAILTVFLPIPVSAGGLGLPPPLVGAICGAFGLFDGLIQLVAFAPMLKRFGPKKIMIATMISFWFIFACFPIMHELTKANPTPAGELHWSVWAVMLAMMLMGSMFDMGFSVNFMFVSAAAPSPALLGTTNGLAQMVISFLRALGPVSATSLFSLSMAHPRWLGLHGYSVFVFIAILTGFAVRSALLLPENPNMNMNKDDEDEQ
ncbi:MFS general substrate transporter [Clavulina sp. PMI_390]|nr:MFS general substrate transporter [Clavulina sp. PMI_390]